MKWWKFLKIDFIISLILSLGFMIWSRIEWGNFVCGYPPKECAFKTWVTQTFVILVVIFVGLFIIKLALNVIFGKKPFMKGISMKRLGEEKIFEESARAKAMKRMKIKPKKIIKI